MPFTLIDLLISVYAVYTKDVDPGNDNIMHTISESLPLIQGLLAIAGTVGSAVGMGVSWLRQQSRRQYVLLKEDILNQFTELKTDTTKEIKANQEQIQDVKSSLCNQITTSETILKDKLDNHKETMTDIKNVVEKIDDKMDLTSSSVVRNTARIDGHDVSIKDLEGEVFRKKAYKDKSAVK